MPRNDSDLPIEVRKSKIQGRGVFAIRRIRKGQRIVEYAGEHITPDEGEARYVEGDMRRHHTFLFTLDENTVIDGGRRGNISRFINHSCDPNAEAIIEDDRIFIYAKRNIQPGTEILYDYQYERYPEHTEEDEKFYACLCGSPKCRGTILKAPRKQRASRRGAQKQKSAARRNGR